MMNLSLDRLRDGYGYKVYESKPWGLSDLSGSADRFSRPSDRSLINANLLIHTDVIDVAAGVSSGSAAGSIENLQSAGDWP